MHLNQPENYQQWKDSASCRQGEYIHFKNQKEQVRGISPHLYNPFSPHQMQQTQHRDPDAMDIDQGKVCLAGAKDILYNKKYQEEL